MRRATITIPDDLERSIQEYMNDQEAPPSLTGLVQAALRSLFDARAYPGPRKALRLTPFHEGSGFSNTSVDHDEILVEEYGK